MKSLLSLALPALVAVGSCAANTRALCPTADAGPVRDFVAAPVLRDQPAFTTLYALGDVHGGYDRMVALLTTHGIIAGAPATPAAVKWSAGDATLVVVGDMIDKGAQGLEVIDLLRALAPAADGAGGHVIVTLGNHEAEFLVDPHNGKTDAFAGELAEASIDACALGGGDGARGAWLRSLPFGARVGGWFFAHAGNTRGRSMAELEQVLESALRDHAYDDAEIVGADSLLEARGWWDGHPGLARANATRLGVGHIVFGHTPDALGPRGAIAVGEDGVLLRIDTGLSPAIDDSSGALLRVTHEGDRDVAVELRADGSTRELWRGPGR